MAWFRIVIFLIYIVLGMYILPKSGIEFDLYKIRFQLLPKWFKIVSMVWIIVSFVYVLMVKEDFEDLANILLSIINLGLFIFLFSEQKYEDEFSEQIRLRAFTYSFVTFTVLLGAFSAIGNADKDSYILFNKFYSQLWLGTSLITAVLYFYITLYKLKKENN